MRTKMTFAALGLFACSLIVLRHVGLPVLLSVLLIVAGLAATVLAIIVDD
jgi:hypothetical protein